MRGVPARAGAVQGQHLDQRETLGQGLSLVAEQPGRAPVEIIEVDDEDVCRPGDLWPMQSASDVFPTPPFPLATHMTGGRPRAGKTARTAGEAWMAVVVVTRLASRRVGSSSPFAAYSIRPSWAWTMN